MSRKAAPLADRFWSKVKCGRPDECWEWQAARCGLRREYGQFYYDGRNVVAHRIAWMLSSGSLPLPTLEICHTCDNGLCCNPAHLWIGTHHQNMLDKIQKGRSNAPSGENHNKAKLTNRDVAEIELLLAQGLSQRSIAKRFGVSQPAISYINNGIHWKQRSKAS